jgi:hypothetical protein
MRSPLFLIWNKASIHLFMRLMIYWKVVYIFRLHMRTSAFLLMQKVLREYSWWLKSRAYLTKRISCKIESSNFVFYLFEISRFEQLMSWLTYRWHPPSNIIQIWILVCLDIWWKSSLHWPFHIKNLLWIVISECRIIPLSYIWWCNCKILNFKFLLRPLFNTIIIII